MSNLWWLEPGWTEALCSVCGTKIWPEGDPDWGLCYQCFTNQMEQQRAEEEHYQEMEAEERRQQENAEMENHFRKYPHG